MTAVIGDEKYLQLIEKLNQLPEEQREEALDNVVTSYFTQITDYLNRLAASKDRRKALAFWKNFMLRGITQMMWAFTFAAKPYHRNHLSEFFKALDSVNEVFIQEQQKQQKKKQKKGRKR